MTTYTPMSPRKSLTIICILNVSYVFQPYIDITTFTVLDSKRKIIVLTYSLYIRFYINCLTKRLSKTIIINLIINQSQGLELLLHSCISPLVGVWFVFSVISFSELCFVNGHLSLLSLFRFMPWSSFSVLFRLISLFVYLHEQHDGCPMWRRNCSQPFLSIWLQLKVLIWFIFGQFLVCIIRIFTSWFLFFLFFVAIVYSDFPRFYFAFKKKRHYMKKM